MHRLQLWLKYVTGWSMAGFFNTRTDAEKEVHRQIDSGVSVLAYEVVQIVTLFRDKAITEKIEHGNRPEQAGPDRHHVDVALSSET